MVTYFSPNLPPAGANVIMITIFSDFDKFSWKISDFLEFQCSDYFLKLSRWEYFSQFFAKIFMKSKYWPPSDQSRHLYLKVRQ
jgi:hypothetical protein